MADDPPPSDSAPGAPLHARPDQDADGKRKRRAEAKAVHSVAGAMAGEMIAAVAGKARKPDPDD